MISASSGPARAALLGLWLVAMPAAADGIKPFTTDGCSEFPDGNLKHRTLWRECCVAHDRAYWQGGTYEERELADEALRLCVARTGEPQIAALMLAGVRVGGSPYWPTSYRWGYGWPWPRGYRALTAAERALVEQAQQPISSSRLP